MRSVRLCSLLAVTVLCVTPSLAHAQPGQPTLVSSADAGANTFTWNAVSGATYYYLWVNEQNTPRHQVWYTPAQARCGNGETVCHVTVAWPNMRFGTGYWWIQAWSPAGYGPWSTPQTFMMRPSKPNIVVDANNRYVGTHSAGQETMIDVGGVPVATLLSVTTRGFQFTGIEFYYGTNNCSGQRYSFSSFVNQVVFTSGLNKGYLLVDVTQIASLSKRVEFSNGTLSPCSTENLVRDVSTATPVDLSSQLGSLTAPFRVIR